MKDEVKMALDVKLNIIREYYTIPTQVEKEYQDFVMDVTSFTSRVASRQNGNQ